MTKTEGVPDSVAHLLPLPLDVSLYNVSNSIKFTREEDGILPFLDTLIVQKECGSIKVKVEIAHVKIKKKSLKKNQKKLWLRRVDFKFSKIKL